MAHAYINDSDDSDERLYSSFFLNEVDELRLYRTLRDNIQINNKRASRRVKHVGTQTMFDTTKISPLWILELHDRTEDLFTELSNIMNSIFYYPLTEIPSTSVNVFGGNSGRSDQNYYLETLKFVHGIQTRKLKELKAKLNSTIETMNDLRKILPYPENLESVYKVNYLRHLRTEHKQTEDRFCRCPRVHKGLFKSPPNFLHICDKCRKPTTTESLDPEPMALDGFVLEEWEFESEPDECKSKPSVLFHKMNPQKLRSAAAGQRKATCNLEAAGASTESARIDNPRGAALKANAREVSKLQFNLEAGPSAERTGCDSQRRTVKKIGDGSSEVQDSKETRPSNGNKNFIRRNIMSLRTLRRTGGEHKF